MCGAGPRPLEMRLAQRHPRRLQDLAEVHPAATAAAEAVLATRAVRPRAEEARLLVVGRIRLGPQLRSELGLEARDLLGKSTGASEHRATQGKIRRPPHHRQPTESPHLTSQRSIWQPRTHPFTLPHRSHHPDSRLLPPRHTSPHLTSLHHAERQVNSPCLASP